MSTKATNANDTTAYAAIIKYDEQEDGTILVYGKATDDTLDSDEQVCDPEWLKEAMPAWFKFGNIREQHSSIAAGVATEYAAKEDGHYITAHVVDPSSAKKVKSGVLKGFSIGIRRPRVIKDNKAAGGRIVDGQIVEISLVDRPANPACVLTMAKMDSGELVAADESLIKYNDALDVDVTEGKTMTLEAHSIIVDAAKSYGADLEKFDQATFDAARTAVAQLIQIEAGEMADGSDESYSLSQLLCVVHYLFEWYEGEVAEGEVSGEQLEAEMGYAMESLEMADTPDTPEVIEEAPKSAAPDEAIEADEIAEASDEKALTVSDVREMIADVVKTLLPTQVGEESVTKSQEAERIEALESELEQVKALAAPSGPKRFGVASSTKAVDAKESRAAMYRRKADLTLDKSLAQGYLDLARDLERSDS